MNSVIFSEINTILACCCVCLFVCQEIKMNLLDASLKYVGSVLVFRHLSVHLDVNHNSVKRKTFSVDNLIAIDSIFSIFFLQTYENISVLKIG